MTRTARRAGALLLVVVLAACGAAPERSAGDRDPSAGNRAAGDRASGDRLSGNLTVFAAASLADAFADIADAFVAAHPDVRVRLNVAGSHTLASQIIQGAPADVYASADVEQMRAAREAATLAGPPAAFARNTLAIAVEPGNPHGVAGLGDLADPGLLVVLPTEQAPAGAYARAALDAAGVTVAPASLAADVRGARSAVALGEADAALVYASDVVAADGRVEGVAIPEEDNVTATYPIAALAQTPNPDAAQAFVKFVGGRQARAILADHGFAPP